MHLKVVWKFYNLNNKGLTWYFFRAIENCILENMTGKSYEISALKLG